MSYLRLSTDCAFSELLNNLRLRNTWDESRILTTLNFAVIELDKFDREDSKMDDGDFSSLQKYVLFDSLKHSSKNSLCADSIRTESGLLYGL